MTEPTSGQVAVCGFNPTRESLEVKRRVWLFAREPGFYDDLSANEISLHGAAERIPEDQAQKTTEVLEQVGLADDGRRLVKSFPAA